MIEKPYIELINITKAFGAVVANHAISLQIRKGEIHALLGENGSGKTTLMNILTGVYIPDAGSIAINGKKVLFQSPGDAIKAGIGMIHQHVKLVEVLSIEENITAGVDRQVFISKKRLREKLRALSKTYGFEIDPGKKVYQLSIGQKQTVAILKVFYRGVTVLILDEPTSVLTPQESRALFSTLVRMKAQGCAIMLITHKLDEVFQISDRVTVLRKGEALCTLSTAETNPQELTEKMVGRAISLDIPCTPVLAESPKVLLDIQHLLIENKPGRQLLKKVSLQVHAGEIHGIAGVAGSGQKELCEAIAGLIKIKSGTILLKGKNITGLSPRAQSKQNIKIGFVPEDRMEMGLVGGLSVADNVILRSVDSSKGIFIDARARDSKANAIISKYDINTSGPRQPVKNLSGGNIQKVLIGRELDLDPDFLITAYPVRGLDVGAANDIYTLLNQEKQKKHGVLFIGEDLDVLLSLCDRISILHAGELVATLQARNATKDEIGLLMAGCKGGNPYAANH